MSTISSTACTLELSEITILNNTSLEVCIPVLLFLGTWKLLILYNSFLRFFSSPAGLLYCAIPIEIQDSVHFLLHLYILCFHSCQKQVYLCLCLHQKVIGFPVRSNTAFPSDVQSERPPAAFTASWKFPFRVYDILPSGCSIIKNPLPSIAKSN